MIKFFRNIRKNMLHEDKSVKYFKYAIGEIILVVIGILIALQINNWNENRNESKEELYLLKALKNGLEADLLDLKWNEKRIVGSIASANRVINSVDNDLAYSDSIPYYLRNMMFPVVFGSSTSAFETLKSKGIGLIKNDTLRDEIIKVYDAGYRFFTRKEADIVLDEAERALRELFPKWFEESYAYNSKLPSYKKSLKPLNYEALKTDQEFKYFLKSFRNRLNLLLDFHYRGILLTEVNALIQSIDSEIKSLEE